MRMKNTLQNKMILYFSLIFFSIILLLGFIMLKFVTKNFQEYSYQNLKNMVETNLELLDSNFAGLQSLAYVIASDPSVQAAVAYRNQTDDVRYSVELQNQRNVHDKMQQLKLMPYIKNAVIVGSKDRGIYSYKGDLKEQFDFGKENWFNDVKDRIAFSTSYFTGFHPTNYLLSGRPGDRTISMVAQIKNPASFEPTDSSYLVSDIDLPSILLKDVEEHDVQLAIHQADGWLHFPNAVDISQEQARGIERKINSGEEYFIIERDKPGDNDLLVVKKTSAITGWDIVGINSLKSIRDFEFAAIVFLLILLFVSGVIIAIASGLISKTILNPVNRLIYKFNRIAEGDYAVRFDENSSEEIKKLSETAEHMIHNMLALSDELLLEQEKLSKEQMRVLQHQINPHFLNNVLQSIKAYTYTGDTEKISKLSTMLGKMLAYSVYQPYKKVEIKTELNYVEQYVQIQNMRFDHKIFYSIDCDPHLENIRVPKLIVQPLVENAFTHGLRNRASGILHIAVAREEDDLTIIVSDNGEGMEEDQVRRLEDELKHRDSYTAEKSIGLLNVAQRIKGEYGEGYGLRIFSKKGAGTNIIITIPISEE